MAAADDTLTRWVKVLDQSKCIGCHACTTACKSENEVPVGVTRTYVKSVDVGEFPQVRRAFQVTRCNQCTDAPCVAACPTQAMYRRADGIVDFDKSACIGCKACMAACPYDAIFINPDDHSAEKCNLCAHRLDIGLEPACVTVCPTEAILVGDLNDPDSTVARLINRQPVQVRKPEKETGPGVFYSGAHQATLDPLAARRPDGGLFAWATQGAPGPQLVTSGHPGTPTSSAAALLSYDVPHSAPWGWRVSLYTWTKSVAAGAFAVPVLLALLGHLSWGDPALRWAAPVLALVFLAITGALLIADLKHPTRFYLIFTRHHWRSWLVRGAFIVGGYGGVLALYFLAALAGPTVTRQVLGAAGLPLAAGTAVYTAYLFAQAKARDLWQSPLLPPHLAVQAVLAGAAAMLPVLTWLSPGRAARADAVALAVAAAVHVAMACGEITLPHVSAHAHLAVREMTKGKFARFFWPGLALVAIAIAAPWIGVAAAPLALAGLLGHEHAYVQAGQSVPLA
ncbi:MAG TPA: 4Fe-4S dicluster domain-containing protein [Streptosporangiaceae bacterium]|nr:4Fe-4S dicluster domain-containing protein [Streptosporangiaceae bacterium]